LSEAGGWSYFFLLVSTILRLLAGLREKKVFKKVFEKIGRKEMFSLQEMPDWF
jgi:hypothetical protein